MPLYLYDCLECKKQSQIRHSYKDKDISCLECGSKNIKKNLSSILQTVKKTDGGKEKAGSKVLEAIEEGREELKNYKSKISKRVYKK